MKFNKLAKELNMTVAELADKTSRILPNANAGTDVSTQQKEQILALLNPDNGSTDLSLPATDPILAVLLERIEQEQQLETPEQIVDGMIARYLENPEDLPADADYTTALITYVELVKKRHSRKQQQSSKLRSLLRKQGHCAAAPLTLESFYAAAPPAGNLNGSKPAPKLSAANS